VAQYYCVADNPENSENATEPNKSGVQPDQKSAEVTLIPSPEWKGQDTLSETLRSLEGRRIVAGAFTAVASAGVKMLEDELKAARSDRRSSDERERETLTRFYEQKENASVSIARLEEARDSSRLRSIMKTLGSLLLGAALTLYMSPCPSTPNAPGSTSFFAPSGTASALGLVGVILLLSSFRWSFFKSWSPK
jgi:hypothetical protein